MSKVKTTQLKLALGSLLCVIAVMCLTAGVIWASISTSNTQNLDFNTSKNNTQFWQSENTGIDLSTATAVTQIGAGFIVSSEKFQSFFTDKLFKSLKDSPKELKNAKAAFNAVSTLVLASIGAKRILTPLLATKIASYNKEQKGEKSGNISLKA